MIKDDELSGLPDDDELAFVVFEGKVRRRIYDEKGVIDWDGAQRYADALHQFVDIYKLGIFDYWPKPPSGNEEFSDYFYDFLRSVDKVTLSIRLRKERQTRTGKGPVLRIGENARQILHGHLNEMRAVLDETDLPDPKREAIMNKLNALAAEIDTNRTKWESWMALAIELADTTEAVDKRLNVLRKTWDAILKRLGQSVRETTQLPSPEAHKQIEGPKGDSAVDARASSDDVSV